VYSVSNGDLPPGLDLDANTGVIGGTPTSIGSYGFTIQATDLGGCSGAVTFTIVVTSPAMMCRQEFDNIGAPMLPAGWSSANFGGMGAWATSTVNPNSPPNDAFASAVPTVGYTELLTPSYFAGSTGQMRFLTAFNLEDESATVGNDGMVLEISINGGPFQDIVAAGGSFVTGGYNKTISSGSGSPIAGRAAWSGLSGGTETFPSYLTTTVNLPVAAYDQMIQMKWIVATDNSGISGGDSGARIDSIIGTACPTTAAYVAVAGRVLTHEGYGVRNAVVTIMDTQSGNRQSVRTGSFGYYRVDDVEVGRTYIVTVGARHYHFTPRVVQVFDNLIDLDLVAEE
jgi:hypothetical protein